MRLLPMKRLLPLFAFILLGPSLRADLAFVALGDWGRDGKNGQRENAVQLGQTADTIHSQLVLALGDNFYDDGVKTVTDSQWHTSFEDIYTARSLQTPWYVVPGNHDYHTSVQAQIDYSKTSARWHMPARYYTWTEKVDDHATAQFFAIDTSPFVAAYRATPEKYGDVATQNPDEQLAWLEKQLTASTAQWKIVFGHHPVYSAGTKHGNTKELVVRLKPLLEKYGVQLYISGHEHDLQYLRDEGSVHYFVSGAGSEVRGTGKGPQTVFSFGDTSGFLAAQLTADSAHLQFVDTHGKILYHTDVPCRTSAAPHS